MKLLCKKQIYDKGYVKLYDVSHVKDENCFYEILNKITNNNNKEILKYLFKKGDLLPLEFLRIVNLKLGLNGCVEQSVGKNVSILNYIENNNYKEHKQKVALLKVKIPFFVAIQFLKQRYFSCIQLKDETFEFYNFPKQIKQNENKFAHIIDIINLCYHFLFLLKFKNETIKNYLPLNVYTRMFVMFDSNSFLKFALENLRAQKQDEVKLLVKTIIFSLKQFQPEFENIDLLYQIVTEQNIDQLLIYLDNYLMQFTVKNGYISNLEILR